MRKRSSYRPKAIRLDNMAWLMQGMKTIASIGEAVTLKLKNHAAMDELVKGRGQTTHCDTVIAALNMTEALAILRLGDEYRPEINAGQDAMLAMCQRGLRTGRFVFTGLELQAVNLAMEVHDAQLDACTVAELERALEIVRQTICAKKARVIEQTS